MSTGGGQQPAQTTQTSDPWSGAQPHLLSAMQGAANLYGSNTGYQPYTGQIQADIHPWAQQGLGAQYSIAAQGVDPSVTSGLNLANQMIQQGGLTPEQRAVAGQMQGTFGNLGNVYSEASGQQNPYLQSVIEASNRRIGDRINAGMSGAGRYGSGAHTDVMARAMAESADPILAQDYAQRQQLRLGALGQQQGVSQAINQLYGTGTEQAGKWAQLAPGLAEAQYAPGQKMQQIGGMYTDYAQQALANQAALYNAQQAYPWEQLQRYAGVISGPGALGGTKVTASTPYTPSTLSRVGGGALAGAGLGSMFGPMGAGAGALGGGLLGLL